MPPSLPPQTQQDFEEIRRQVSTHLEQIGLSPYEAKAYIALIAHGYGPAETIAETAGIPRTSAYKILEGLQEKGFAFATEGRPRIFKPEPPARIRKRIFNKLEEMFTTLELLHEIVHERGTPQLIFTITGKEKTLEKIGELIDRSTQMLIICTPILGELQRALSKKFRDAQTRGVSIMAITAPGQRIPDGVKVIRRQGLIATDVVCDNQLALIAASDLSACGYTDNALLAEHLQHFLEIVIEH